MKRKKSCCRNEYRYQKGCRCYFKNETVSSVGAKQIRTTVKAGILKASSLFSFEVSGACVRLLQRKRRRQVEADLWRQYVRIGRFVGRHVVEKSNIGICKGRKMEENGQEPDQQKKYFSCLLLPFYAWMFFARRRWLQFLLLGKQSCILNCRLSPKSYLISTISFLTC